jgi:chloramphenicol-sensitive protein RarD
VSGGDTRERDGIIAGVVAYTIWGLFPLYFPLLLPARPLEIVAHRIVWSLACVAIVLTVTRGWPAVRALRHDRARTGRLAVAAVFIAVNWLVYIWAANNGHVVDAALGYFVTPLVTVLLGVVVLHEKLRPLQQLALVFGIASVVVLAVGYGRVPWIALALALSFGSYGYIKKTVAVEAVASLAVETAVLAPVALVVLGVLAVNGTLDFGTHAGRSALLVSAGVATTAPLVLFAVAARRMPLSMLGLLLYVTPFLQFVVGVVVRHEHVPPARWVGFVLVWIALVVLTADAVRASRPAPVPVLDGAPAAG